MLGQCRLAKVDGFFEFADGLFAARKLAEDQQAALVAHGLQQCARFSRLGLQIPGIHGRQDFLRAPGSQPHL
jgi:hypothetical protein